MASKFWAPATSLLLALLPVLSGAQAFGRLGASPDPIAPGFEITREGFRASPGAGSQIRFMEPLTGWSLKEGSDRSALWEAQGDPASPSAFRASVRAPGFEMRVREGFRLQLNSTAAPLLTVAEATYDGVSAPHSRWILLTFKQPQPSLLFGFLEGTSNARISGRPGDWQIQFGPAYSGWVRVSLPFGAAPLPGTEALVARAGRAAGTLQRHMEAWSRAAPRTVGYKVERAQGGLRVTWTFDRPGAVIPPPLVAAATSTGVVIDSPHQVISRANAEGPLALTTSRLLQVRLPTRPMAQGRRLMPKLPPGISPLAGLFAAEGPRAARFASLEAAVQAYRALPRGKVPGSSLASFTASNPAEWEALSQTAYQHSLALSALGLSSQFNLALVSSLWARDPHLLTLPGSLKSMDRVAAAALMSPEPERQAEGALLAASLAARPAMASLQASLGLPQVESAPLSPELAWLAGFSRQAPAWMAATASPVEVLEGPPSWVRKSTKGWVAVWHSSGGQDQRIVLRSRTPLRAVPIGNITRFAAVPNGRDLTITARAERLGACEVLLKPPDGSPFDFPTWPKGG